MILLIDNYDSFTYNLYQYLGVYDEVQVFRNDKLTPKDILKISPDKIVISPGPKTPKEAGNCLSIIKELAPSFPILGVCLGHQCIGDAFGATITYAKELYHGKTCPIKHTGQGIFKNIPSPLTVTRYHSLVIDPNSLPDSFDILATSQDGELMAIQHKQYSLVGLQFHPESITTDYGLKIIENFLREEYLNVNRCG